MTYRFRFVTASLLGSSLVALVVACTANGGGDPLLETDDASPTEPVSTSTGAKLPPKSDAASPPEDAGHDAAKDAAKDGPKEAGVDAGKPAPNPGDACPTIDDIFPRTCGICGTQEALCQAKPDGTPGIVSDYSGCTNELAGGCLPGTTVTEDCGNCGTHKKTCSQYCAWTTGACAGEPVNSCTPTTEDFTTAGCPVVGTVRQRSCDGACTWSNFAGTCGDLDYQLVVAGTAGDSVSAIYPLRASMATKRMSGTCPNGYFSTTTNYAYAYVELINPTETTLTLSAWNTAAPNGGPILDTLMTWYAGSDKPTDDASRKTCAKGVIDSCPTGLPCLDYRWAGLTGASAITIPPMTSALVFFQSYYPTGGATVAEGPVKLVVRTDTAL